MLGDFTMSMILYNRLETRKHKTRTGNNRPFFMDQIEIVFIIIPESVSNILFSKQVNPINY